MEDGFSSSPLSYAMKYSTRNFSPEFSLDEQLSGITYFRWLQSIASDEEQYPKILETICVCTTLFCSEIQSTPQIRLYDSFSLFYVCRM